jgi:hypothetical protein
MDQPSSSTHTREALGWQPTYPSLLEDLRTSSRDPTRRPRRRGRSARSRDREHVRSASPIMR